MDSRREARAAGGGTSPTRSVPAGEPGAAERAKPGVATGGAAWPGDDNPDWMHDTRPGGRQHPGRALP